MVMPTTQTLDGPLAALREAEIDLITDIATALTENSLKLISMKGLIDTHLSAPVDMPPALTERSIEVMHLMDGLL